MGNDGIANDDRWDEWARRPARPEHFSTQSLQVVDRVRNMTWNFKTDDGRILTRFSEIESHLMDKSTEFWARNVLPPYVREHAIFVYQSIAKPEKFTARIVTGAGATTMGQLRDFSTRTPLEMQQMPQVSGHRLVLVEHTHPVASASTFGARGFSAPSNKDVYIAAANPGVAFIVQQRTSESFLGNKNQGVFYYFGF